MRAFTAVAIAMLVGSGPALADDGNTPADARARARESYERAEQAITERRFGEALVEYRRALELSPSAPFASIAQARATDLAAHAEGDFVPLARLEEVRRSPAKARDRRTVELLERDVEQFPEGRVRSETRLVIAESWWHSLGEPERAATSLLAVLEDPAAERLTRALALAELVSLQRELGDLDGAYAVATQHGDLAPATRAEVGRLWRRVRLRAVAIAMVAVLGSIGLVSAVRLLVARKAKLLSSRVVRPTAVAFALYTGGAGALLAHLHGDADPRPFLWLGLGVLAIDVIARTWTMAANSDTPMWRSLRAATCVMTVLAAAFLVLERSDAAYLESFGL